MHALLIVSGFVILAFLLRRAVAAQSKLGNVPAVGSTVLFGYPTAFRTTLGALRPLLLEGYAKYRNRPFRIADLRGWIVYISSPDMIQQLRKAPDDVASFQEQVNELLAIPYTMAPSIANDPWHNAVAHKTLTSNLGPLVPELWDEACAAFDDQIGPLKAGEWKALNAHDLLLDVVCRISNRMFVGLPLCRDKVYTKISIDYTITVMLASYVISAFPEFLRPLVSRYVSGAPAATKGFERFLVPVIEDRLKKEKELGAAWSDKPNDFLQWSIDAAPPEQKTAKELTLRMMVMNFAAIHTSTSTFTNVLYNLAMHPEYAQVLREEAQQVQEKYGDVWTKEAVAELVRIESFIKETMRYQGIMLASMQRRILRPLTFSDGTTLPAGVDVAANLWAVHHDPAIYEDPWSFKPWRFSGDVNGTSEKEGGVKRGGLTVATSEWLAWGHGAHVCPGRHFAALEFKLMLACLVLGYDLKMEAGLQPKETVMGNTIIPDGKAKVLFKKRQTAA